MSMRNCEYVHSGIVCAAALYFGNCLEPKFSVEGCK